MNSHKVALKVLRLSRPRLIPPDVTQFDDDDQKYPRQSTLLALPSSFGSVYVGETFSCMLSLSLPTALLQTQQSLSVVLSVTIQLPVSKEVITLIHSDSPESQSTLTNDTDNHQHVINYEAKEVGLHVLTATITYKDQNSSDDGITFRKHYQFTANPGINVKTKLSHLALSNNSYSIEAQIENVSENIMTLETATFIPAQGWKSDAFEDHQEVTLLPKDIWQLAFITSKPDSEEEVDPVGMGSFTMSWRRNPVGEKGWLSTGPIKP
jgi:hypothetical protein